MTRRRWIGVGLLVTAGACLVVAYLRRHSYGWPTLDFHSSRGGESGWLKGTVFDPFHPSDAYLWAGLGAGLVVAAVLATVARPRYLLAASAVCLLVAFLRRHSLQLGGIEGAYFERSVGAPAVAAVFGGNRFDPFHPLEAYLWLGAAVALATASPLARLANRPSP